MNPQGFVSIQYFTDISNSYPFVSHITTVSKHPTSIPRVLCASA
jgi:hypothetical protein